jgi:hypothetical protein
MMKQIGSYVGAAKKIKGQGSIEYKLWVDCSGNLYVQIVSNDLNGTFTSHGIPVSKYASLRNSERSIGQIEVFDLQSGAHTEVRDNNNGAFLKAVLRALLPDEE